MADWRDDWIGASEAEFLFRDRDFYAEQSEILSQAVFAGASQSSGVGLALYQSLDAEITGRAKVLVDQFNESLAAQSNLVEQEFSGVGERAENALKKTYEHLFHQTQIGAYLAQFKLEKIKEDSDLNLRTAIQQTKINLRRAGGTAMKKQAEEAKHVTIVTVHGHGNIVQAGIHKSVVGLKFDQSTVQNLTGAFEELRTAINNSDVPSEFKEELIEVTDDCRNELEKPKPNRVRFTSLLGGLATSIQTVASLNAAWEMFKATARLAGIEIP